MLRSRRSIVLVPVPVLVPVLLALLALLVACGDDTGTGPDVEIEPVPAPVPAPPPPPPAAGFALTAAGDGLLTPDGTTIPLVADAVQGSVDHWKVVDGTAEMSGWAAVVREARPAESVVVVVSGGVGLATAPDQPRPDVAEYFDDPALEPTGWTAAFPVTEGTTVRVFGVTNGVGSELEYPDGYPWPPAGG